MARDTPAERDPDHCVNQHPAPRTTHLACGRRRDSDVANLSEYARANAHPNPDPDQRRDSHFNSREFANRHTRADQHTIIHRYRAHPITQCDRYQPRHANADFDSNVHAYRNSIPHSYGNGHPDGNPHRHGNGHTYGYCGR